MEKMVTCCFCRKEVPSIESNNPHPLAADPQARCCSDCNMKYVVPERLKRTTETRNEEAMEYRYGMKYRGFSPGAQPMESFKKRENDQTGKYHDILVYNKPLEPERVEAYELDFLGAAEAAPWI